MLYAEVVDMVLLSEKDQLEFNPSNPKRVFLFRANS